MKDTRLDRRTILKTLGVGAVGGTVMTGSTAASGGPATGCEGFDLTDVGVNTLEGSADNVNAVAKTANDPEGRRGKVAHVVSKPSSRTTDDYITLVVPLSPNELTLGDIDSGATLTYEFYGGEDNEISAPDEVWLRLEEPDGTEQAVYHHGDDGAANAQTWKTRNVHEEIKGSGISQGFNWFRITGDCGTESLGESLLDDFDAGTEIIHLGAGRGTTSGGDVLDIYFDNPRADGNSLGSFPV